MGTCGALIYGLLASRWTARGVLILFTVLSSAAIITFILSSSVLWIAMVFGILVGALMNGCISGLYTLNPLTYDADIRSTGVGLVELVLVVLVQFLLQRLPGNY